jgi:hypothetical protein
MSYAIHVQGTGVTTSCLNSHLFDLGDDLFKIAWELIRHHLGMSKALPDSTPVLLLDERVEEWLPPRCRKPRKRVVRDVVARFTLGDFRREGVTTED